MKIQQKCEWLLLFFIHEIDEYRNHSDHLVEIIKNCRFSENNEIWILLDEIQKTETSPKVNFNLTVFRLEITPGSGQTLITIPYKQLGIKTPNRNSWKKAIQYIYRNVVSERKILFTWSHGAAFGINTEQQRGDDPANIALRNNANEGSVVLEKKNGFSYLTEKEITEINNINHSFLELTRPGNAMNLLSIVQPISLSKGEYQPVAKEEIFDCKKIEVLWMSDLAEVLKKSLRKEQIDLLIMMNCNMQLFENGFMLKDVVKIMVGPESMMWADGYDYQKLLDLISSRPDINNEELAIKVVDDYVNMHKQMGHQNYLDNNAMFANSLARYKKIASILQASTKSLLKRITEVQPAIDNVKENLFYSVSGRNSLFLLDLGLWMKTIFTHPEFALHDQSLYQRFLKLKEKTVIAKHIGESFIQNDLTEPKKYGHSCCSLFFPKDNEFSTTRRYSWCQYFSNQLNSSFQKKTVWDEFIRAINTPPDQNKKVV